MTVLVFTETKDGKLKKASREALTIGRRLAESAGGDLVAFATDAAVAEEAGRFGAKKLYVAGAGDYLTETYTAALAQAAKDAQPKVLLFAGTSNGRDLAPRVAARLNAGVASDVDRLEWTDGKLRARRPVYSGKAFATVEITSTPAIATLRPNAFPAEEAGGGAAEVVNVSAY
jgi:electron transfer flavoprotein alpha subunit